MDTFSTYEIVVQPRFQGRKHLTMAKELISIDVTCKNVTVFPNGNQTVTATLDQLDLNEFISNVDMQTIVDIIGAQTILECIDKDDAIKFYDIEEA